MTIFPRLLRRKKGSRAVGSGEALAAVSKELGIARKLLYEWRWAWRRHAAAGLNRRRGPGRWRPAIQRGPLASSARPPREPRLPSPSCVFGRARGFVFALRLLCRAQIFDEREELVSPPAGVGPYWSCLSRRAQPSRASPYLPSGVRLMFQPAINRPAPHPEPSYSALRCSGNMRSRTASLRTRMCHVVARICSAISA